MSEVIKKYVSRYVVPFYFDYNNGGYAAIVNYLQDDTWDFKALGLPKDCCWVRRGFWENYNSDDDVQPEMDIYTYLLEILRDSEGTKVDNLGVSYVLKSNGRLIGLQYVKGDNRFDFDCKDLGVLLFRNGIGFIWYNVEFRKGISIDTYVAFQHDFKELARSQSALFQKQTGKDQYEIFCMGKWLVDIFKPSELGMRFWAGRKMKSDGSDQEICLPDKALLFQYMFIDSAEEQERMDLAFRVANGYDRKYNTPSALKDDIYEPFGNTCFYTSKAGTAYIVSDNESNAEFFENGFGGKYIRDYFFIYVMLLYQTFSCAHYSRLLTKLPAEVETIESDNRYTEILENLHSQINLFLVKSVYESVSNIQHQNGVYIYGKKVLRIEEDMKSLTVGLEALRVIEVNRREIELQRREKTDREELERKEKMEQEENARKDSKLNQGIAIFGLIAVVSALNDALCLVDWYSNNTMKFGHRILLSCIVLLTGYMIFVLIFNTNKKK